MINISLTSFLYCKFQGSSKRESRLQEIQDILDDPKLTVKEIHSVRWLSYFNALTSVYHILDSIFTYLSESNLSDAKATGLKKKVYLSASLYTDSYIDSWYLDNLLVVTCVVF